MATAATAIDLAPSSIGEFAKKSVRRSYRPVFGIVHVLCYLEYHTHFGISPVVPLPFYLCRKLATRQANKWQFFKSLLYNHAWVIDLNDG